MPLKHSLRELPEQVAFELYHTITFSKARNDTSQDYFLIVGRHHANQPKELFVEQCGDIDRFQLESLEEERDRKPSKMFLRQVKHKSEQTDLATLHEKAKQLHEVELFANILFEGMIGRELVD